ncbi:HPr kinase/phosphorylase [Breznakia sp. PF5-3]|uniref:HPr(Ser) kinase/phosphatase n=1 Tax=unclassified Breznakia TaxID=2623764 RepID=UPI00240752EA|nr:MULTISPECIES: HPr(Ser) kinase/phosphatase [unclassified Breznakia]MDF9825211.1 HPr kinase/phosphorylase [Breznakia sp. PM6-1]MDF9836092.1 HPr kinase/phosphorylase [Breznakia sp. PF5-3]MDF9838658.1 HPr kinase/phosphorylase [Breznakia sp. PFB2-8]MDF9860689.1 HPr kinase/phosphorylase [Breznakia sp. PH5-24]
MSTLCVKEFVEHFDFEVVHGNKESLKRVIKVADTNRAGLELAGFFDYSQPKRIVVLGDKEIEYIKTMSEEHQHRSFEFITGEETPLLIISKNHECPAILAEIAYRKNFPILRSKMQTSRLVISIVSYLDEKLAKIDSLHGVLLSIYGKGVFIRGESGMGKSEVALDLIRRGHQLISDDLVDCYLIHNEIIGHPPKLLEGFIELRGIGIVNIRKLYGTSSTLPFKHIDFVIELKAWDNNTEYDRVGIEDTKYEAILGVNIPKIILPLRGGRSMATIIESAVTNIVLKEEGYDSAKDFENRVLAFIDQQKGDEE